MSEFKHWISLILRRFSKKKGFNGDNKPLIEAVIPTATMVAEWAKNNRDDVSQLWVFGSSINKEEWDYLSDDLDILLIVPDEKWTHKTAHDLPREVPLSEHYLQLDTRVCKESQYRNCMNALHGVGGEDDELSCPSIVKYVIENGVCVWDRDDDKVLNS